MRSVELTTVDLSFCCMLNLVLGSELPTGSPNERCKTIREIRPLRAYQRSIKLQTSGALVVVRQQGVAAFDTPCFGAMFRSNVSEQCFGAMFRSNHFEICSRKNQNPGRYASEIGNSVPDIDSKYHTRFNPQTYLAPLLSGPERKKKTVPPRKAPIP